MPLIVPPTGLAGLLWPDGEAASARAATKEGSIYSLSHGSVCSLEELAETGIEPLWFLAPVDGSADVFCHASVVESAGYETLPAGASVICEVAEERRGPAVSSIIAADTSTAMSAPVGHNARKHGAPQFGRHHDAAAKERYGVAKFYDAGKGFGFVVADDGGADVFLHGSVLGRAGLDAVEAGQQVSVMVTQGRRGLQATDIELL